MMYSQLVRFDPDMNPVPELAESWEISKDGLTWTFKLRQGVKFHDGQEMTSADVKFTFDRLFEKSPGKSDFIAVDKVEPSGRYAVKFITKEPFAGLLAALGGFWGFIISEAGIKKHGDLNKAALGTGPFMLEDWKVEQQMVLKRHPGYFKKGAAVRGRGRSPDHSRRGQHRGGPSHRADPSRVHRGQQELQPAQGREDAHRLPQLAARLRLPQHQRHPRPAQGRARPSGHQLDGGSLPGPAGGRGGLRPPHRARHRADEAVAAPRGAMDAVLQAGRRQGEEAHGRRGPGGRVHREARW